MRQLRDGEEGDDGFCLDILSVEKRQDIYVEMTSR